MSHISENKDRIVARVRRIAGQVAAVERSVESGAPCGETLHLVAAVRGAVNGLMDEIAAEHLRTHVAAPGLSDAERAKAADELETAMRRHLR